jgi:hypothetical protein
MDNKPLKNENMKSREKNYVKIRFSFMGETCNSLPFCIQFKNFMAFLGLPESLKK